MARIPRYDRLATERRNRASAALDRMRPRAVVALMNREDARAVRAVARVGGAIARAVDAIVAALAVGGRLFFVGAGTSGRLGVLEAAECPPTFGTRPALVQAIMAGGRSSVFRSREGAEDDTVAAARAVRRSVRAGDVVVGVSASGVTPFVRGALGAARRQGARTVLVCCNPSRASFTRTSGTRASYRDRGGRGRDHPPGRQQTIIIAPAPGPEVLAGSTRLKAGTATKLVLNALTTASMARLGRVYGNRMIDVQPRSRKLRERAVRLVAELARVPIPRARRALSAAGGQVRVAIVMTRMGCSAAEASRALGRTNGALDAAVAALGAERSAGRAGGRSGLGPRAQGEQHGESRQLRGDHTITPASLRRRSRSRLAR